jgi:DNA polymerase-1
MTVASILTNKKEKVDIKNRPYIFIDGFNNFLRHFFVNQTINSKSEPIGGVVGFLRFLNYTINTFAPSKIFVVWETGGGCARRKAIFKGYKENRSKLKEMQKLKAGTGSMKDKLAADEETKVQQLTLLYKLLKHTPVCQVFVSGTECDDVIGYLVGQYFRNDPTEKIIISNDKDFYQLLEDKSVVIYDQAKREIVDAKKVYERTGISARNFCMARALIGDTSDNIGGIAGMGMKTAAKRFESLLSNHETDVYINDILEECTKQINNKSKIKVYSEIKNNEDIVRRNWKLMHLSSGMLSANEISKIDNIIESHEPKMNKIALVKDVISSGMSVAFDFDSFSSQLRILLAH